MPVRTAHPGVYIQEQPSAAHAIVGLGTSVTAFAGAARWGPVEAPVRIFSFTDYVRTFGPPIDADRPMGHAVAQFFVNGGAQAVVVRVASRGAGPARATLRDSAAKNPRDVLRVEAAGKGEWANRTAGVGVELEVRKAAGNPDDLFDVTVTYDAFDEQRAAIVEAASEHHRNLSMSPSHPRFAPSVLAGSSLVRVSAPDPLPATSTPGFSTSAVPLPATVGIGPGNRVLRVAVDFGPFVDVVLFPQSTAIAESDPEALAEELDQALDRQQLPADAALEDDGRLTITSRAAGPDSSVVVTPAASNDASRDLKLGHAWGGKEASSSAELRPAEGVAGLEGGSDGAVPVPGPGDIVPQDESGGVFALRRLPAPRFNLLCLPGVTAEHLLAVQSALAFCRDEHAFLIVDSPRGGDGLPNVEAFAADGAHGALYYPRLRQEELLSGGTRRALDLPACGAVAGVIARTDTMRGVWKAPAGIDAGIAGASDLTQPTSDAVSGQLNPVGVNVLRSLPAAGLVVWGARTLRGADALASEHKYIPIRRLTDHIATSLQAATQWAVFEPNDPDLWAALRVAVTTFMRRLYQQGAFQQGPQRDEASSFFVLCDETVNPQAEIDLGRVNLVVGFAPLKPAEFVVITITQMSQLEG